MSPEDKLQRARIALLLDEPFFGTLLLGLKCREAGPEITKTMATDGASLFWSREFVQALGGAELKTVLAHETLHAALGHALRRGERDPKGWNIACDRALNTVLERCNLDAVAVGKATPFVWPTGDFRPLLNMADENHSAEELYADQPEPKDGGSKDGGKGDDGQGMGDVLDAPGDEAQKQEQEATWKCAIVQAAAAAKAQGKLPAAMARLVDEVINPKISWQDVLRSFVREHCRDDYSWARPNARYAASGFMLPSLHSRRLGRVAVAIDTSGSISESQVNVFMGEVEGICHECRPEKIVVIDCDAKVHSVGEFEHADILPRDFTGGGGTSHLFTSDASMWPEGVNDLEVNPPVCLICFTDLATTFPEDPGYPVLWVTDGDAVAPFGTTIKL